MVERRVDRRADLPAVVGQFLQDVSLGAVIVELIQNELDAESTATTITFHADRLTCEGNGRPIEDTGWRRLEMVMGAGGQVAAKPDGIGAKNRGLRTGFLLGDSIEVQSDGQRIDLTVIGNPRRRHFDPATIERVPDPSAPSSGTRISIPYRRADLRVQSAEGFTLHPLEGHEIAQICSSAIEGVPPRFIGVVPIGTRRAYQLHLRSSSRSATFEFRTTPSSSNQGVDPWIRTCRQLEDGGSWSTRLREIATTFSVHLSPHNNGKVPWPFRRGRRIIGEIAWEVDARGRPKSAIGRLRYPITYPEVDSDAFTGHGFHISAPFISDAPRHGIAAGAEPNALLVDQARSAFVDILRRHLVPTYGAPVLNLLGSPERSNTQAERDIVARALMHGALAAEPRGRVNKRRHLVIEKPIPIKPVVVASLSCDPTALSPDLFRFAAKSHQILASKTPRFVVEALLHVHHS